MPIQYKDGDATCPPTSSDGVSYIIHVCNDVGAFARGFALCVKSKFPIVEQRYKGFHHAAMDPITRYMPLGMNQYVKVDTNLIVVNMIAQHGIYSTGGVSPIRYDALEQCLEELSIRIGPNDTVHAPRLGSGLSGGSWSQVEPLLQKHLGQYDVTIYDFEPPDKKMYSYWKE